MLPLIDYPEIVKHYAPYFETVFSREGLMHFQRYVSGLMVSENKTVEGINELFVKEKRNQSSVNRWLTESPFSLEELNRKRLALLAERSETRLKANGVLGVDDTLLTHYGQEFEQIAFLYDHVEGHYVWAHNLVTLHYSDDQIDYPIDFALWKPADRAQIEKGLRAANISLKASKESLKASDAKKWRHYLLGVWRRHQAKPQVAALYESKLVIARRHLKRWVCDHPGLKLPVAFDSWYTQPEFCRFIDQELQLPFVGTLDKTAQVILKTGQRKLTDLIEQFKKQHEQAKESGQRPIFQKITIPYKGETETYYSYCQTHRIHNFGKLRLVINFRQADLSDSPASFVSNRLHWQAYGITRIRRHRGCPLGPIEVFHEEGKDEGLDQYQVRDFQAISRHVALVVVTYSLLRAAPYDTLLFSKLQCQLEFDPDGSAPFWRRIAQAQSLWSLACFISLGLDQGQSLRQLMAPLLSTLCK
jgi:hypothetical protein